jgi:hypothetical protein
VSDRHLRILRLVARRARRNLENYDAVGHVATATSARRRQDLARTAMRSRDRVTEARARRHDESGVLTGEGAASDGSNPTRPV